ncbi:cell envelope integrity protein CreD [Pseudoduganella sp. OTU4001]|uniref:cell envelope integrity protein CreD n=1 Tax=Pseudoduganella sp. OTU4001 TaxID=3043854 RepID=UPI00313A7BDC
MQKRLLVKAFIVAVLMFLLGAPLAMIQSVVQERMQFRDAAAAGIAEESVGAQQVYGPVLVMPYDEEYTVQENGEAKRYRKRSQHLVFPQQLDVASTMATERRYRGIHQILVYNGSHKFSGDFLVPALSELPHTVERSDITPREPYIALAVEDTRGVRDFPQLAWGKRRIEFEQGARLASAPKGLHARLPLADAVPGAVSFSFDLNLGGLGSQAFVPLAKNNRFTMTSAWPHPQFGGQYLPEQRNVTEQGFQAVWRISALATNAQQQLREREAVALRGGAGAAPAGQAPQLDAIRTTFIEPVNVYSMADRATKYGLLFVALTFAAFFLFEVMKRLPIHPVQYALVGMALALFFLLLVSLSEHIDFVLAYVAASAACIVLIGYYLAHVLHNWKRGASFAAALGGLYGVLFGLLNSESNALVMGAILLFAVLSAIMVATRKVDWYRLGEPGAEPA